MKVLFTESAFSLARILKEVNKRRTTKGVVLLLFLIYHLQNDFKSASDARRARKIIGGVLVDTLRIIFRSPTKQME